MKRAKCAKALLTIREVCANCGLDVECSELYHINEHQTYAHLAEEFKAMATRLDKKFTEWVCRCGNAAGSQLEFVRLKNDRR